MNTRRFGIIGEKIAQSYLRKNGYEIITTNFFSKNGEIDIVAEQDQIIIFVEVKTRTNYKYGTPAKAVDETKRKHMRMAAGKFLSLNNFSRYTIRFDVIEIIINNGKCNINHLKQIMWNKSWITLFTFSRKLYYFYEKE